MSAKTTWVSEFLLANITLVSVSILTNYSLVLWMRSLPVYFKRIVAVELNLTNIAMSLLCLSLVFHFDGLIN
jgi:hypothetical protein